MKYVSEPIILSEYKPPICPFCKEEMKLQICDDDDCYIDGEADKASWTCQCDSEFLAEKAYELDDLEQEITNILKK
jgi:hypothetical protein